MLAPVVRAEMVQIDGAGATFPYPIYSKWFSDYNKLHPDVQINYQSIGSGGGIRQLHQPDGLLRRHRRPDDEGPTRCCARHVLHFPTVLGGVVPVYNLTAAPS